MSDGAFVAVSVGLGVTVGTGVKVDVAVDVAAIDLREAVGLGSSRVGIVGSTVGGRVFVGVTAAIVAGSVLLQAAMQKTRTKIQCKPNSASFPAPLEH